MEPTDRAQQRAALVSATMASFLTPFLGSSVVVALPSIGADLGMTAVQLSWVATAFLLASAVCLVPFGRAADLLGRKRVFIAGMTVFTAASLGCAFAGTAPLLLICRAIQGVGGAMIFGTGLAILTSVYPPGERGRVIGLNASAVYIGLSVGPFAGGLLTRHFGWHSLFLAAVPLGVTCAVVAGRWLRTDIVDRTSSKLDAVGAALYGGTLVALMLGLSAVPRASGFVLVGVAALAGVVFIAWERRVAHPMLDVPLLAGNAVFAWSNLAALINYSATSAVTFLVSLYLQYLRGFNPAEAGVVLLVQSVVMAVTSPFAGRISDRVEPRVVASLGMALTVAGLIWLSFLRESTPIAVIVGCLVVLGLGFGLFSSPNTNAVMSSVPRSRLGVASATLGTMRLLGQTASMGLAAAVLAVYIGRSAVTPAVYDAFLRALRFVFMVSAGLCVVGVFASLSRGKLRPQ